MEEIKRNQSNNINQQTTHKVSSGYVRDERGSNGSSYFFVAFYHKNTMFPQKMKRYLLQTKP